MKLQEKQKKQAGITLVALVVTIIILIILATISIRMVIGEGGLIWQANNGKIEYRAAEVEEEVLAWKTEHKLAKYANEIKPKEKDDFIDDQASRGLLTKEEADTAKKDGQVQIGSKVIDYNIEETKQKGTLDVELQVKQAEVTGEKIPVTVSAKNEDGEEAQDVTYTFYKNGVEETKKDSTGEYTFNNLNQEDDYTLKVIAKSEDGATGEDTVTVRSLKMEYNNSYTGEESNDFMFFRYEGGMTWGEWAESDYPRITKSNQKIELQHGTYKYGSLNSEMKDESYLGVAIDGSIFNEQDSSQLHYLYPGIVMARYVVSTAQFYGTFGTIRPEDLMPYYYFPGSDMSPDLGEFPRGLYLHERTDADCIFGGPECCIAEGTMITLSNGEKVPVEELTGNEKVLVWNMYTGNYEESDIAYIVNHNEESRERRIIHAYFSDDTEIEIVNDHGFFDLDLNQFVLINEANYKEYIGHWFVKENLNGDKQYEKVQLKDVKIENRVCRVYEVVTPKNLTCFTNGLLSVSSLLDSFCNIFEVDRETLTYDKELMQKDIEKYGLFSYDEYEGKISREAFEMHNLQYMKIALGKGVITEEQRLYVRNFYNGNMSYYKSKFDL